MAGTDKEAFNAALGRVQSCYTASRLSLVIEEEFHERGYRGPVAVYGPYVRDSALYRDPVVLNVALDLTHMTPDMLTRLRGIQMSVTMPISLDTYPQQHLREHGYQPQLVNDRFNQETFLKAVLGLQPIRINAIGATPAHTLADPNWDFDALYNRFVIRQGAHFDSAERPEEMLEALTSGKYRDWKIWHEDATGDIREGYPPSTDSLVGLRD